LHGAYYPCAAVGYPSQRQRSKANRDASSGAASGKLATHMSLECQTCSGFLRSAPEHFTMPSKGPHRGSNKSSQHRKCRVQHGIERSPDSISAWRELAKSCIDQIVGHDNLTSRGWRFRFSSDPHSTPPHPTPPHPTPSPANRGGDFPFVSRGPIAFVGRRRGLKGQVCRTPGAQTPRTPHTLAALFRHSFCTHHK
jgi:hypothetical protein